MVAALDITGQRFGRLVAVERIGSSSRGRSLWLFQCDCGTTVERETANLRRSKNPSCGCFKPGWLNKGRTPASKTHGLSRTRIHKIWSNRKNRCRNSADYRYRDYGGRGIGVCDEWASSLEAFASWAFANGYRADLQIDRIDNDAGYSPENCRWVTPSENMRNQRSTIFYAIGGRRMSLSEAAERFGLRKGTIQNRIEQIGMTPDEAVSVKRLRQGAKSTHGRYSKYA
jgi:hypothetical protein